ncbi:hypothetical protein J1N35_018602 [Gossypium stocksii]|uniref:Uncharacterized protein n=1 Tax=Gossypium stocksii TaxID=47602 RepID=A0A9D4A786_9ROSI|nr:hypothetical protein J1N35_018602 [Gossypium stocksii]
MPILIAVKPEQNGSRFSCTVRKDKTPLQHIYWRVHYKAKFGGRESALMETGSCPMGDLDTYNTVCSEKG